jgi:putative spermidine/putrescine transport system substrate-binding protein
MDTFTRREMLAYLGLGAASIALAEAGLMASARAATPARPFTWAATGGQWGEQLDAIFVGKGGFAQKSGVTPTHSFQLETVAVSKIVASNGDPPYDVSNNTVVDVTMLNNSGLLLPFNTSLMPNLANVYETGRIGNVFAGTNFLLFGLVWNTKQVPKAPTSFKELLSAGYKGRIGIPAYGWFGLYWLQALNKELGGNEDNVTPGITAIADMVKKNKAVMVENAAHASQLMEQGEVVMMPLMNGIAARLQDKNVPVQFGVVPGTLALVTGFVILKGTPYEEAANRFINLTLDPELQAAFSAITKYPPTNRRAVLPAALDHLKVTEADLQKTARLDWSKVVAHKADYLKRWNEEVLA